MDQIESVLLKDGSGNTSVVIAANGTADFDIPSVIQACRDPKGYYSLQLLVSGGGTVKVEPYCSIDGATFAIPDNFGAVMTGKAAASNGSVASFSLPVCAKAKLRVTETGGSSSATVGLWLSAL